MKDECFLDTNIFICQFDERYPKKCAAAEQLIYNNLRKKIGIISFQVIQEFIKIVTKKFSKTLSIKDIKQYIHEVLNHFTIVWPSVELYLLSLDIQKHYKYSFYDSLIIAAAQEANCKTLYSEDLHNGQKIGDLKIINPFD